MIIKRAKERKINGKIPSRRKQLRKPLKPLGMQGKPLSLAFGSTHQSFKACLGQETEVGAAFLLFSFQNHNQLGMPVCVLTSLALAWEGLLKGFCLIEGL